MPSWLAFPLGYNPSLTPLLKERGVRGKKGREIKIENFCIYKKYLITYD